MKTLPAGVALIKSCESCKLQAYPDPASPRARQGDPELSGDPWTIGYGHTRTARQGQTITQAEAEALFQDDLARYEEGVADLTRTIKLTPGQFSALVSFAFNLGITKLASSTLYKRLLAQDFQGAAGQFEKWVLARGHVMNGLKARRAAERALFES